MKNRDFNRFWSWKTMATWWFSWWFFAWRGERQEIWDANGMRFAAWHSLAHSALITTGWSDHPLMLSTGMASQTSGISWKYWPSPHFVPFQEQDISRSLVFAVNSSRNPSRHSDIRMIKTYSVPITLPSMDSFHRRQNQVPRSAANSHARRKQVLDE